MDPIFVPLVSSFSSSRLFPDIEPGTINAVLNHTLRAWDLYLLDPRVQDVEPTYVFNGFTSSFEKSTSQSEEYSTLDSVIFPLHNYFAILLVHNPKAQRLPVYLLSYLTHLQSLAADYEWDAVLEYHTLFFNRRSREMEESGDYSAWSGPDIALLCTSVYPHRISTRRTPGRVSRLSPNGQSAHQAAPTSTTTSRRQRPRTRRRRPRRLAEPSLRCVDPT
ncbi:hypothetical protein C8R43DRAFT_905807 [Mycena crocata]|nr:hypothetical protein C8R43DRAFT_905807 [Mycena crocata]